VQPLRPTAEETASLRIAEELNSIEEAVRGGSTDLRALGFWRVVEAIKRDPVLVLDHADQVGRIDRVAFHGRPVPRDSMSAYYYSGMREAFVGVIFATAAFLAVSKIAEINLDNAASFGAGVCGAFIAFFPTGRPSLSDNPRPPRPPLNPLFAGRRMKHEWPTRSDRRCGRASTVKLPTRIATAVEFPKR